MKKYWLIVIISIFLIGCDSGNEPINNIPEDDPRSDIFTPKVSKPLANPSSNPGTNGTILSNNIIAPGTLVTLSCSSPDAIIYYTIDGSNPTDNDNKYTLLTEIKIIKDTTLKAIAIKDDMLNSDILIVNYLVDDNIIIWKKVIQSPFGSGTGSIVYGNNVFVASSYYRIGYSFDGINWNSVINTTFGSTAIYGICYGNGKFIAYGDNGLMAYSNDGISWEPVPDSTVSKSILSMSYGNNKFIASVWETATIESDDGIIWKKMTYSIGMPNDIVYGNGKYVSVYDNGMIRYGNLNNNFTSVSDSRFDKYHIESIAYGNGVYVAGGWYGRMAYSNDGIYWIQVRDSAFQFFMNALVRDIVFANGKFIAVGDYSNITVSEDGITWNKSRFNISGMDSDTTIISICYGNNMFVAITQGGILLHSNYQE